MNNKQSNKLAREFKNIVNSYIVAFGEKHDIEFDYWVADRIGEIAVYGDFFFNLDDIRFDIDNDVKEDIIDWYNESIDKALAEEDNINFRSWINF